MYNYNMIDFKTWESSDINGLLRLLVGQEYGQGTVADLDDIVQNKYYEAQNIIRQMALTRFDRVIDLGSGCGFIANHIAGSVQSLQCVDISGSFLDYARQINQTHPNVSYHQISYADMSNLASVTAIYSVAVFIHFNLYDCYLYLQQCYNRLRPQGRMLFDILNDACIDITLPRWQRHSARYLQDRDCTFINVHYNNPAAVMDIARQVGFSIVSTRDERDQTFVLLRKP
jgi:cyclopropane fatty-acyl-phospholipid synthase-like methyltransferase